MLHCCMFHFTWGRSSVFELTKVNFSNFHMRNQNVRLQFTLPVFEALQSLNSKLADSFLVSIPRMNDNPCCQSMIQTFLIIFNCVAFVSYAIFFSIRVYFKPPVLPNDQYINLEFPVRSRIQYNFHFDF